MQCQSRAWHGALNKGLDPNVQGGSPLSESPDGFVNWQVNATPDYAAALQQAHKAAERHNRGWGSRAMSVLTLTLQNAEMLGLMAEAADTFEHCGDPSSASELLARADEVAGVALAVATRMRKVLVCGGPR